MQSLLAAGADLPDPGVDRRLVEAIDAAMYGAGALQELLDDPDVENIDINGCDEVWVTYADARGKVRGRPVAATDEDLDRRRADPRRLRRAQRPPVHPGPPRARPAPARRVPPVGGDGRLRAAPGLGPPQPVPADVPRRGPAARRTPRLGDEPRRRPCSTWAPSTSSLAAFLQAAVTGPLQHRHRRRHRRREDHPAARPGQLHPARTSGWSPSNAPWSSACGRHPDLHRDVAEMEEVLPSADGGARLSIGAAGAPHPAAEPLPGHRRGGPRPRGRRDALGDEPGQRRVPVDHPRPRRRRRLPSPGHLRRPVRGHAVRGHPRPDRARRSTCRVRPRRTRAWVGGAPSPRSWRSPAAATAGSPGPGSSPSRPSTAAPSATREVADRPLARSSPTPATTTPLGDVGRRPVRPGGPSPHRVDGSRPAARGGPGWADTPGAG